MAKPVPRASIRARHPETMHSGFGSSRSQLWRRPSVQLPSHNKLLAAWGGVAPSIAITDKVTSGICGEPRAIAVVIVSETVGNATQGNHSAAATDRIAVTDA